MIRTAPGDQPVRFTRGVNLGNALEAPREGEWGVVLREEYFRLIKEAGFDAVRIPIRWSAHADALPPYKIETDFFERVDWAIEQALSRGLVAIINVHHYDELMNDPKGHEERFLALWEQIASRYQKRPRTLIFELLNEPHGNLTAPIWNQLLAKCLAVVRRTNPDREVVIGPVEWNSINALDSLELPAEDRHIIVTFHYYSPFQFTHQGAEWVEGSQAWLGTKWSGGLAPELLIRSDLDRAAKWGEEHQRPLFLGEFGAYSKADMASRAAWTSFVARQAEARGIPWAYWEFCAGFGVYDRQANRWNREILEALIPPKQ